MTGFDVPTKLQVTESCDTVESVLDLLRDHTDATLRGRSRILSLVKGLFTSLQRLEDDVSKANGAFNNADPSTRHNLAGVLRSCCAVAGQLHKRIDSNELRHDDGLGLDLTNLTAEIEEFLTHRKRKPAASMPPSTGTTSNSSALVEDLWRKQQDHESEVEALEAELRELYSRERTFEQEIAALKADLAAKDSVISGLDNHDYAKLFHIRRLHAAISNLGLRHPMTHQTRDWDDLTVELPAMVERIENINLKLKELELERDARRDQELESEAETVLTMEPSARKPLSVGNASRPSAREKDRDKKKDATKMKEHGRPHAKLPSKVRSPSPTASNTSKSVRRNSRNFNTGSGFFFGH